MRGPNGAEPAAPRRPKKADRWGKLPVFSCLALGPLLLGCGDNGLFPGGDAVASEPFQFEEEVADHTSFRLIGINGRMTVTGVSEGEAFRVSGFRQVHNCSEEGAQAWLEQLEVRLSVTDAEIIVETLQPTNTSPCSLIVDYDVTAPRNLTSHLTDVNGPITLAGLHAGVSVTTVNGEVNLEDVEGGTTVRVTNGNVTASAAIDGDEAIDLRTVNGNLDVAVPRATSATVSATLTNGTVGLHNLTLSDPLVSTTSVSGTLGSGEGSILLRTTNGTISLSGR